MAHILSEQVPIKYCVSASFDLFEQLAEAINDWELDFRQLDAINNPFRLQQLYTPDFLFGRAALDSHFHQRGGPTLGFRTFALHTNDCSDYQWCGERADLNSLVVMPQGGEFESVSRRGFDIFTISLSTPLLERTAELEFHRPLSEFLGPGGKVHYRAGGSLLKLRNALHSISEAVGKGHDRVADLGGAAGLNSFKRQLAYMILSCLERGDPQTVRAPRSKRQLALYRAIEFIEHTPQLQLSVSTLVEQVGVSRRSLEYAFQDGLGMSPANYLKVLQLRALHKELLEADPQSQSVAEISVRHGFRHAGQLATDYRGLFGELPSFTLRRAGAENSRI